MTEKLGGYGIDSFGRHEFGNSASVVEPRFSFSYPADDQTGVNTNTIVKMELYSFSSYIDENKQVNIEISEDGGLSYITAFENGVFHLLFNVSSKIRRKDGQRLNFYFIKIIPFLPNSHIMFRVTTYDEFGNQSTKTTPIYWE